MVNVCFVSMNPTVLIILSIILSVISIYLILVSQSDKMRGYIAIGFIILTLFSILFFTCWAVAFSAFQLIVATLIYRNRLKVLRLS